MSGAVCVNTKEEAVEWQVAWPDTGPCVVESVLSDTGSCSLVILLLGLFFQMIISYAESGHGVCILGTYWHRWVQSRIVCIALVFVFEIVCLPYWSTG